MRMVSFNSSKLTRSELRQFLENSYNPGRMTLCGVGGVEHKQLKELAEKYFGDLSARSSDEWSVFERGIRFTGSEVSITSFCKTNS